MILTYIILIAAVIVGIIYYIIKPGKFEDKDGNNIPDVVDEKIAKTKKVVGELKGELKEVLEAAKEVAEQSKEVVNTIKNNTKKVKKQK